MMRLSMDVVSVLGDRCDTISGNSGARVGAAPKAARRRGSTKRSSEKRGADPAPCLGHSVRLRDELSGVLVHQEACGMRTPGPDEAHAVAHALRLADQGEDAANRLRVEIMTDIGSNTRYVPSTAADIMRQPVVTVSPTASLRELVSLLRRAGVSGVPVVDMHRTVVGTVSVTDLLWLSDRLAGAEEDSGDAGQAARSLDQTIVRDVMTPDVFGVEPHASLVEIGAFFARTGLGRAVVLDGGKLPAQGPNDDLLRAAGTYAKLREASRMGELPVQ